MTLVGAYRQRRRKRQVLVKNVRIPAGNRAPGPGRRGAAGACLSRGWSTGNHPVSRAAPDRQWAGLASAAGVARPVVAPPAGHGSFPTRVGGLGLRLPISLSWVRTID